jgi:hypothetical protein
VLMTVGGLSKVDQALIALRLKKPIEPELHRLANDTIGVHMERLREHIPATAWQLKAKGSAFDRSYTADVLSSYTKQLLLTLLL